MEHASLQAGPRAQKITLSEMRESGPTRLIVYFPSGTPRCSCPLHLFKSKEDPNDENRFVSWRQRC